MPDFLGFFTKEDLMEVEEDLFATFFLLWNDSFTSSPVENLAVLCLAKAEEHFFATFFFPLSLWNIYFTSLGSNFLGNFELRLSDMGL